MTLTKDDEIKIKEKWINLCKVHKLTKKYTLLAEEYSIEMQTYIQPIKEQKDAYEHIVRVYEKLYTNDTIDKNNILQYILKNLDKALSHEFRAFYDTMDYISIVIREVFYNELKDFSYKEIISVYPEYEDIKKKILGLPSTIAKLRETKDIGIEDPIQMAEEYCQIINELFDIYQNSVENIFKKIEPI